ncbi:N-acetyltransferase family protein [Streptomyces sp. NPDC006368]|uniref:GNAT family N-acetyltransferase n=1 Tax=Streptomyces sp. NPDC006368 TaxID=3156760 RepID=UPI0033BF9814
MSDGWTDVQVSAGAEADLGALTDIYNHYVRETAITFDTEPFSPEQRLPWLRSHPEDGPHRLLVAHRTAHDTAAQNTAAHDTAAHDVTREGAPTGSHTGARRLGYATSSPFRPKAAYSTSVEVSVYLAPEAVGRGIGTLLYDRLFGALADEDVHRVYAGIALPNDASVRLHARFGFRHTGTFTEVGRKFGRYWDVAWYEKDL